MLDNFKGKVKFKVYQYAWHNRKNYKTIEKYYSLINLVRAVSAMTAFFSVLAAPDGVEMFYFELYKSCIVGEHADLKVTSGRTFHAYAGTGAHWQMWVT